MRVVGARADVQVPVRRRFAGVHVRVAVDFS